MAIGIPRKYMPQLDDVEGFVTYASDNGVDSKRQLKHPESLVPTQREYNVGKVKSIKKDKEKFAGYTELEDKPVITTNTNRILDGHHRWGGSLAAGKEELPVLQFNTSFSNLFRLGHEFVKQKHKTRLENLRRRRGEL